MRGNLFCLENPGLIDSAKSSGRFKYGKNTTFVINKSVSTDIHRSKMRGYHIYTEPRDIDDEKSPSLEPDGRDHPVTTRYGNVKDLVPTRGTLVAVAAIMEKENKTSGRHGHKSTADFLKERNNYSGAGGLMTQFTSPFKIEHNVSAPLLPDLDTSTNILPAADLNRTGALIRRKSNQSSNSLHKNKPLIQTVPRRRAGLKPSAILGGIIRDAKPGYERLPVHLKLEPVKKLGGTWSQFDKRLNKPYNPAVKERADKWDVHKPDLLEFMQKNRDILCKKQKLMQNIDVVQEITGLHRNFPSTHLFGARPHKFVPNDAHSKLTQNGYARNPAGKPYFT
jgi:hypothetical protein